ncbi:MAG: ABC transporter ATP-binding protein [bacterium]|nr:ABC transporter ATP-binding protein [bacterium]
MSGTKKEVVLRARQLCKTFSNGGVQQHILKNLEVEIYRGDFTIIMGASGAGKSTLMYALSGMDQPTLGDILFCGQEITKQSDDQLAVFRRKNCGFVFQQIYMMDNMSLFDNTMASGLLISKNKKAVADYAKELFSKVNMEPVTYKKTATQVSGGEAQRAGIVRALINKPSVLFADEPTGALNSSNSEAVLDVFTDFHREGQSIVMVTHDLRSAMRGNRVIYLRDGQIQGECDLGMYNEADVERRHKLDAFLNEMGY